MTYRIRRGLVISSLTMAISINGEATITTSLLICIAMILQLRLGSNLKLIIIGSSLRNMAILVHTSRMEIGYSYQDGTALKTQTRYGAQRYRNLGAI